MSYGVKSSNISGATKKFFFDTQGLHRTNDGNYVINVCGFLFEPHIAKLMPAYKTILISSILIVLGEGERTKRIVKNICCFKMIWKVMIIESHSGQLSFFYAHRSNCVRHLRTVGCSRRIDRWFLPVVGSGKGRCLFILVDSFQVLLKSKLKTYKSIQCNNSCTNATK